MRLLLQNIWLPLLAAAVVVLVDFSLESARLRRSNPQRAMQYWRLGLGIFAWLGSAAAVLFLAKEWTGVDNPLALMRFNTVRAGLFGLWVFAQLWMLFGKGAGAIAEHPTRLLRLPQSPRAVLLLWCSLTLVLPGTLAAVLLAR